MKKALTMVICILVFVASSVILTQGETLTVCKTCKYQKIQEAIEDSSSGDVISIDEGTYRENIRIDKSLVLRGKEHVTIKGTRKGYPIMILGGSEVKVNVAGIKITEAGGGDCYNLEEDLCPHGILVRGEAKVELENLEVEEVDTGVSGIEVTDSAQVAIKNSKISGNLYGLSVENNSIVKVDNAVIKENIAEGILVDDSSSIQISDSTITGGMGGIMTHSSSKMIFKGSRVTDTFSGIAVSDYSQAILRDSNITDNMSGLDFQSYAKGEVENCNLEDNTGGITVQGHSEVTVNKTRINGNMRGVVLSDTTKTVLKSSLITNNTVGIGAIEGFAGDVSGYGNEIYGNEYNLRGLPYNTLEDIS